MRAVASCTLDSCNIKISRSHELFLHVGEVVCWVVCRPRAWHLAAAEHGSTTCLSANGSSSSSHIANCTFNCQTVGRKCIARERHAASEDARHNVTDSRHRRLAVLLATRHLVITAARRANCRPCGPRVATLATKSNNRETEERSGFCCDCAE